MSVSDSLSNVSKSVLNYATIIYIQNTNLYNFRLFDGKSVFSAVNEIFEQEYIGYSRSG